MLYGRGFSPLSTEQLSRYFKEVTQVYSFRSTYLIEHPGYNDQFFAMRNGEYIVHDAAPNRSDDDYTSRGEIISPAIACPKIFGKAETNGSLAEYRKGLKPLLKGQHVLTTAICASLAACVLAFTDLDSFTLSFVTKSGSGKTSLLRLAASAWGRPKYGEVEDSSFFDRLETLEQIASVNDHPLIIDGLDSWFALENSRQRIEKARLFASIFEAKTARWNSTAFSPTRLIVLTATSNALGELCGDEQGLRDRLGTGLLTILLPTRKSGVAEPTDDKNEVNGPELMEQLNGLITMQYGHAGRQLVASLLKAAFDDDAALRAEIHTMMREFADKSGGDCQDGSARRDALRFGLIAAAGQLATRCGALPRKLDTDAAVLASYRMYANTRPPRLFLERLASLAFDPKTIDLGGGHKPSTVSDEQREAAVAYRRSVGSKTEVYIRPEQIYAAFPDWDRIKKTEDVRGCQECEGARLGKDRKSRHRKPKKSLGRGRDQERVYCFAIERR